MPEHDSQPRRSALLSFQFLGVAMIGSLTMALVAAFAPLPAQVAVLGAQVSILAGLFVSYLEQERVRERQHLRALERLSVPITLAADPEIHAQYLAICHALMELIRQPDPILREMALLKLASVSGDVKTLAGGSVAFGCTEAWRRVYDEILDSPDIVKYRSVAWVRSPEYWQDQPGRQSMEANFRAVRRRVRIERIVILSDELWPKVQLLPSAPILGWLENQHNHGIWLTLVRESELGGESDLPADFGIYGERAVGTQELDERCRTLRFSLDFSPGTVRLALERWQRLSVYAVSFSSLLDRHSPAT
jgi:hypothetical protein